MAKRSDKSSGVSLDSLMYELGRLEARREQIAGQIRRAVANIGGVFSKTATEGGTRKPIGGVKGARRTMSAEARAKIAAAQKARWAKLREDAEVKPPKKPAKKTVAKNWRPGNR